MSVVRITKLLKEFDSIIAQGTKLPSETQEGIKALIKAAPKIKTGELRVADVVEDEPIRKAVLKRISEYAPSTKEYLGTGTREFALSQQTTVRPTVEARKAIKLESVKKYLETNINALKKGKGNFENLLNDVAINNLKISNFKTYKKEANINLPKELKPLFEYFNKFATSEKYKRMKGNIQFTPKVVQELKKESLIMSHYATKSPEEVVSRFLFRSSTQPNSDVVLLNPSQAGSWKNMKYKIGGRKIDFESIKKGMTENDPLFAEVKNAYDYKKAVLSTKVMNPKTSMLENLNKVSYDVLGKNGSDLFHMSHIYDVARTPLSFIQVTFGPYNRQMHHMLRGKKIPGGFESFLERTEAVNVANPFAPNFIKKTPQVFAEEAAIKLNDFYKLQRKKKSVTFDKFMKFKKGGIVGLQNIKA
jgi:hypothetical protein